MNWEMTSSSGVTEQVMIGGLRAYISVASFDHIRVRRDYDASDSGRRVSIAGVEVGGFTSTAKNLSVSIRNHASDS
jgi:hypothetical protein